MKKNNYVALCLFCRDRPEYVKEWVEYHLHIGIDKIYIYDNCEYDKSILYDSLVFYIQKGLVTIIPWRKDNKNSKQLRAYKDCLQRAYRYRWLGFIDSDEFVVLLEESKNIKDYLCRYEEFGGLGLYWLMFGSNNHKYRQESVIKAYTQCCPNNPANLHIKSFVYPIGVLDINSPHGCSTQRGTVNVEKQRLTNFYGHTLKDKNKTKPIIDNVMRVNHYYTRSYQDFFEDKMSRSGGCNTKRVYKKKDYKSVQKEQVFNDDIIKLYSGIKGE